MTIEAHGVHIDNIYKKIDELSKDCESQHNIGLQAIQRVHQRIDDFTSVLMQMSEINRDVQSLITHQKTLEAKQESLAARMNVTEAATNSNTETANGLKRIAWAMVLGVGALIGGSLWQVVIMAPK